MDFSTKRLTDNSTEIKDLRIVVEISTFEVYGKPVIIPAFYEWRFDKVSNLIQRGYTHALTEGLSLQTIDCFTPSHFRIGLKSIDPE